MGYRTATPIQKQAIPVILEGRDLIASAQTGTGKTAAYLIPIIDRISHSNHPSDRTTTLVLVPTRELAKQIDEQVEGFGYFASITSLSIYGGGKSENWEQQKRALTHGADIIIATPGRLMAHLQLGYVKLDQLECLILDEADKMLDMGFSDDILQIISHLPKQRQNLLFSATMPEKIRQFAQNILHDPAEIRLAVSKPAAGIDQQFYLVYDTFKLPLLQHLIQTLDVQSMILFTSRKSNVTPIERALRKMGYAVAGITSDRTQEEREVVLRDFKNKQFQILVATDVMSRGIDIDSLSHVVNFDLPREAEDYVHRIGRTARAAGKGTAITFVSDHDQDAVVKIEKLLERQVEKKPTPPEIGVSPEFDPQKYRGRKPGSAALGSGIGGGRDRDRGPRRDDARGARREGATAARQPDESRSREQGTDRGPRREERPRSAPVAEAPDQNDRPIRVLTDAERQRVTTSRPEGEPTNGEKSRGREGRTRRAAGEAAAPQPAAE
ncbi:MAG: DEAD/DEAH box helicase [Hymenobacteraceae bacterium]|nr:DEAD/DEAH box helicase [Hymenobacteraceae bacterium]